jgi:hypothetical protein
MDLQIILVLILTFFITIIGTIAYSVRIVGIRTGRIAVSFALFNIFVLISRTATTLQAPLLTKYIEKGPKAEFLSTFNSIIITAGFATIIGTLLIPTFQRIFYKAVESFAVNRSMAKLLLHSFSRAGIIHIKDSIKIPHKDNITKLNFKKVPKKIILLNTVAVALVTISVLSPIYAGSIAPDLRATCVTLSGVINGFSTIIIFILVDPYLSLLTDDVISGKENENDFRSCLVAMVGSKIVGTFLSLLLLVPAANFTVFIAKML